MIKLVVGPMFSGKSKKLFDLIDRYSYKNKSFIIFKPKIDDRAEGKIFTRDNKEYSAINIKESKEILEHIKNNNDNDNNKIDLIIIDEVQFFDMGLVRIVQDLAFKGIVILIAGLDKDINGNPFGVISDLLAIADEVEKLKAVCHSCRNDASFSIRLNSDGVVDKSDEIKIDVMGEKEYYYEARCYNCFYKDYYGKE